MIPYSDPLEAGSTINTLLQSDAFISFENSLLSKISPREVTELIIRGLGDRLTSVRLLPAAEAGELESGLSVWALNFAAENVNRVIDLGPAPGVQGPAEEEFHVLWGTRAELRRFKDGTLREAVIWSSSDSDDPVWVQVIRYLITRHCDSALSSGLNIHGPEYQTLLPHIAGHRDHFLEIFSRVETAFDLLERTLLGLRALPLQIKDLRRADPSLRFSSIDPLSSYGDVYPRPIAAVLRIEGSGRWPDELQPINEIRAACVVQLARELSTANVDIRAQAVCAELLDDTSSSSLLEVRLAGITFQIDLHIEKHALLLEQNLQAQNAGSSKKEKAISQLRDFRKRYVQAPLHTQFIRQHCHLAPILSYAIRLLKLWTTSQLLSDHVPEELCEAIAMCACNGREQQLRPSSPMSVFFCCLVFIASWNWRVEPLVMPAISGRDAELDHEAQRRLAEARRLDPNMRKGVAFVAAPHDRDGFTWTSHVPPLVAASRLTLLARSAVDKLRLTAWRTSPDGFFIACRAEYDLQIFLRSTGLQGQGEIAAKVLKQIQMTYGNTILFFSNRRDCSFIGAILLPVGRSTAWGQRQPRTMVSTAGSSDPQATLNRSAISAEISRMLDGQVERIRWASH